MYSIEEKIDNATQAALKALGLESETSPDIEKHINVMLREIAGFYTTDDCEDE